ncbi:DUF4350 domain-containing protein [Methermicoccus shengliensis]|uniref:DUF4350 domain-containing protein n=1 Tax=Methermicoccus shengliensis TaxID=660064 RepID=UPI0005B26B5D|nr:DUF4350 domain-containing protein [Methermicoccus shengliensis]
MRTGQVGIIALVLAVLMLGVGAFSTNSEDFSAYNHGWNGYSKALSLASARHEAHVILSPGEIESLVPPSTTLVLASPNALSVEHSKALSSFVENGGRLVVCEDYGRGNDVLSIVGASTRFTGEPIFDYSSYWINVSLPVAEVVEGNSSMHIVLNYPTSLLVKSGEVLAYTGSFAFADIEHDYEMALLEHRGRVPIVAIEDVGRGEVVCIADPSVFINAMLPMANNSEFFEVVVGNRSIVAFDQCEQPNPPMVVLRRAIMSSPMLQLLLLVMCLVGTVCVFKRNDIYDVAKRYIKR